MNLKEISQEAYKISKIRENDQQSWNRGYIDGYRDGLAGRPPKLPFKPEECKKI